MTVRIAILIALLAAAGGAAWLVWHVLGQAPAVGTTPVVAVSDTHAYQYVSAPDISWEEARRASVQRSWNGHPGYLATIDDANEYQFVMDHVFPHAYPDVTYLGGRQTAPGAWRWVTGPDAVQDGGRGRLFWRGDEQGAAQGGRYVNWMSTAFQHGGKWDVAKVCCVSLFSYGVPQFSTSLGNGDHDEHVDGYLVEFGS